MNKKPTFMMMVGLPGSGKSTIAEEIKDRANKIDKTKQTVLLSSDELRKEMFGSENDMEHTGEVFNEMRRRTRENLKAGNNVIYDATNISSRRRTNFLKCELKNIECKKICVYMPTIWLDCIENDKKRSRSVGNHVIMRMRNQLDIPCYNEGWDLIQIHKEHNVIRGFLMYDFNFTSLEEYRIFLTKNPLLEKCVGFDQNSPYHDFTLDEHMYKTYRSVVDCGANYELKVASFLHDIGKAYCKTTGEDGISHYYNHDRISAQLAVYLLKNNYNLPDKTIIKIATLIQNHMKFFNKYGINSLKEFLGDFTFSQLTLLNKADKIASKEE